jgi:Uma2 family endonuclease
MSIYAEPIATQEIVYPDSDGQPMADNTKQFCWIVTIQGGLDALFKDEPNVFVAGDLLWYPVEGKPTIRLAPDVMVVFGRPKGDRGSYQQWREGGITPQVVFEILSPGNSVVEMTRKFWFYDHYGVEEYYIFDPDTGELSGWLRADTELIEVEAMRGWVSPRLGVRFDLAEGELLLYRPDGRPFESYVELERALNKAEQTAAQERQRAEQEHQRAEQERQRAEQERQRAERLEAQLRALGIAPEADEG